MVNLSNLETMKCQITRQEQMCLMMIEVDLVNVHKNLLILTIIKTIQTLLSFNYLSSLQYISIVRERASILSLK